MASEVILTEFQSDTAKSVTQINALIASVGGLDAATAKTTASVSKLSQTASTGMAKTSQAAKSTAQAYKEQDGVINKLRFSVNALTTARDKSNSPALIQRYNKLIDEQNAKLKSLTSTAVQSANAQQKAVAQTGSQFASLKTLAAQLGPAIGVAFGVQQVVQFGKESVAAYIDAEKNASLLLNALSGNETVQARLLKQASEFQKTTVYDDDTIIRAQTFLATQGRNEAQITKTVAAAVQLSAVTGDDLQTSVEKLDATYEGSIGRLGKLDERFKGLTKEQLANGAAIDLVNEKYAGFAEAAGNTADGKLKKLQNQFGELQETVGEQLVLSISDLYDAFTSDAPDQFINKLDEAFSHLNPLGIGLAGVVGAAKNLNDAFIAIREGNFTDAVTSLGAAAIDLYGSFNPLVGLSRELGESFGFIGGEALKASSSVRAAGKEFNLYLEELKNKLEADVLPPLEQFKNKLQELQEAQQKATTPEEYQRLGKEILAVQTRIAAFTGTTRTLLEGLNAQLAQLSKTAQNTVAAGGVVNQGDVDRIIELEKRLKAANEEYTKLIQRTRDRTGFNASAEISVQQVGEFDIQPAEDYAQQLFEINEDAGDKILQRFIADEERKREELEKTKQIQQQFAVDTLNNIVDIAGQLNDVIAQRQIADIDRTKEAEIKAVQESTASEEDKQKRITAINKRAAQEQYQIQLKQFRVSQALQIANATIQGAQAVLAAFSSGAAIPIAGLAAGPAFAAVAAVLAGAQIAIIAAQPPPPAPSFFKGTPFLQRGANPAGRDTIPIMADEGEAIIPTDKNAQYPGLAKAWINGDLEQYIHRNFAAPMIEDGKRKMEEYKRKQMAEAIAVSLTGGKFDDRRLFGGIQQTNSHLGQIVDQLKKPPKRRG